MGQLEELTTELARLREVLKTLMDFYEAGSYNPRISEIIDVLSEQAKDLEREIIDPF